MMTYTFPTPTQRPALQSKTVHLIASGDLRESANVAGWPMQVQLVQGITRVVESLGMRVVRANGVAPTTGNGFISSQRMGLEVFKNIPADAPLIVAEAVWQYSHHVLAGLRPHGGPPLYLANFPGDWAGLAGLLGPTAGVTKTA